MGWCGGGRGMWWCRLEKWIRESLLGAVDGNAPLRRMQD
jgi:hypothetical protein